MGGGGTVHGGDDRRVWPGARSHRERRGGGRCEERTFSLGSMAWQPSISVGSAKKACLNCSSAACVS